MILIKSGTVSFTHFTRYVSIALVMTPFSFLVIIAPTANVSYSEPHDNNVSYELLTEAAASGTEHYHAMLMGNLAGVFFSVVAVFVGLENIVTLRVLARASVFLLLLALLTWPYMRH